MTVPSNQVEIPCVVMRGGTSKGVFFKEESLPAEQPLRDQTLLAVMGSPDVRQIDGLGGSDFRTSKIAIIGRADTDDADVTYTFGQVGIDRAEIGYGGNCGNISSAVGVYAIEEGFVAPVEPYTTVRIYNTNSDKILLVHVPVEDGSPVVDGDCAIAGVPGAGAEIRLDFSRTLGATTGKLLPTGHARNSLFVPELGKTIEVSIVDVAKATVFFHPSSIGIRGTENPGEFTQEMLDACWAVRGAAASLIGLSPESALPTPVAVTEPTSYVNYLTGEEIGPNDVSVVARRVVGPPPNLHKAFAGTGGVCLAVAARLRGTTVNEAATLADQQESVLIGHPSGVFPVRASISPGGEVTEASFVRTARRLMEGTCFVPRSRLTTAAMPSGLEAVSV